VANGIFERIKKDFWKLLLYKFDKAVISQTEIMGNTDQALLYLDTLRIIQPTSKLPLRQQLRLSMKDLR